MPFKSKSDLPKQVKSALPSKAQEIYESAYNNAYDRYKDKNKRRGDESREETAGRVAWSAVKRKYKKSDDGKWHPKS